MIEIERKFLVKIDSWNLVEKPEPTIIQQGYISSQKECTVRVRTKGLKGYLTIKGLTTGISRVEFEYEIPVDEAKMLLAQFSDKYIDKLRYEIEFQGKTWEVDVFQGKLAPLVIAEIELNEENEAFELPEWVDKEVSNDERYYNSNLVERA